MTHPDLLPTTQRLMDRAEALHQAPLPAVLEEAEHLARATYEAQGLPAIAGEVSKARQALEAEAGEKASIPVPVAQVAPPAPFQGAERGLWILGGLFMVLAMAFTLPDLLASLVTDLRAR